MRVSDFLMLRISLYLYPSLDLCSIAVLLILDSKASKRTCMARVGRLVVMAEESDSIWRLAVMQAHELHEHRHWPPLAGELLMGRSMLRVLRLFA